MSEFPKNYFAYKSIRDPLYGFIDLSKIEIRLIDTPAFRRLLNIKQLSHAFLVYPTAIHTRFEHSLGVTYLANKVAQHLDFKDEEREIIRLAGLLHDIGHGPFSHLFESVLKKINSEKIDHEKISMMLIKEDPDISAILGDKKEKIIQLLDHKPIENWDIKTSTLATDIISGPLDVDKMDYLRRDSYHIGVAYGQFDLPRLTHTITSTNNPKENKICIDSKGMDSVESYRLGRYLMHAQVYEHHARIIGEQMFLKALNLAVEKDTIPRKRLSTDADLENNHLEFLNFYTRLDDRSIYDFIMEKDPGGDAASILNRIRQRKLLKKAVEFLPDKEIEDAQISDDIMTMNENDLGEISDEIAGDLGQKKHDIIVHISEVPVHLYEGDILIMWKGVPRKLDNFSPINATKSAISKFYIFGPDNRDVQEGIKQYAKERFGVGK